MIKMTVAELAQREGLKKYEANSVMDWLVKRGKATKTEETVKRNGPGRPSYVYEVSEEVQMTINPKPAEPVAAVEPAAAVEAVADTAPVAETVVQAEPVAVS